MAKTYMKLDGDLVPISLDTVGTTSKEEQTKTVTPDFSSGNVVVTPDANKVLTQVTVVKDNDLTPENIVKDVNIFGVVGTAETGGGLGAGVTVTISKFNDMDSTEEYWIKTIEDGVGKSYGKYYNYNQLNLTLYKVQYICICDSHNEEIRYGTLTGATATELKNGLIPTGNINLFEYSKD